MTKRIRIGVMVDSLRKPDRHGDVMWIGEERARDRVREREERRRRRRRRGGVLQRVM
jgi:hypothetical protein